MAVVSMKQLLDSGVHFGHQTRRWNPKMKRFIFTERNGIYIIDLQQTLGYIDNAYEFVKQTVAHGGSILFVGTKRQAQEVVAEQATRGRAPRLSRAPGGAPPWRPGRHDPAGDREDRSGDRPAAASGREDARSRPVVDGSRRRAYAPARAALPSGRDRPQAPARRTRGR